MALKVVCDLCGKEFEIRGFGALQLNRIKLTRTTVETTEEGKEVVRKELVFFDLCPECQNKLIEAIESKKL